MRAAKYWLLQHRPVAIREDLPRVSSQYSQITLPGQRAVLPHIDCGYLPSFLCFSIDSVRLQSMNIQVSSHGTDRTADVIHMGLKSQNADGGQHVLLLENDCLLLLLMQAAQNTGCAEDIKREMLTEISYM